MKLLLIEGPDRCGKNLLIKNLVSQSDNYIVRHCGLPFGNTDLEKRDYQFQFFKKEFELASKRELFNMHNPARYPKDIWILNRAHLGEFVYGKMYRETHPEEWIFQLEEMFGFHLDVSVHLLLLTAEPEFLCSRDDGKSFTVEIEKKQTEIHSFEIAFNHSKILNKKIVKVSNGSEYLDQAIILDQVNKFLNF